MTTRLTLRRTLRTTLAVAPLLLLPLLAQAHRSFLVPSSTVLSQTTSQWVSVDAARGNDLFFFNHNALPMEGLEITSPAGASTPPAKLQQFRYKAVFEWQLTMPGTWRAAVVNEGLRVQWQESGNPKRWNGAAADFAKFVPKQAEKLSVNEVASRVETFVTMGKPTPVQLTGKGLEVGFDTHPNDLVAGEPASFRFFQDGKPASALKISIIPGGARYRDSTQQMDLVTDEQGRLQIRWPAAGLYWMSATARVAATVPQAKGKTLSYAATLEVLP